MPEPRCAHTWRDQVIGHEHRCGYESGHRSSLHNCWCGAAAVAAAEADVENRRREVFNEMRAVDDALAGVESRRTS